MENFVIILKEEHTGICILKPSISVKVTNRRDGTIYVEIKGSDALGASVFFHLDCGDFQGRYIEDYDKDTQQTILDSIETSIAKDIALYAETGFTYVGVAHGDAPSECFILEDHKVKWKNDYRRLLQHNQKKTVEQR